MIMSLGTWKLAMVNSDKGITNFHVPGSTLVVMVAALLGDKWREAYDTAIARRYRMLSFGDAMVAFR